MEHYVQLLEHILEVIRVSLIVKNDKVFFDLMSAESELISYANIEAIRMGLKKRIDIKLDPRLGFDHYVDTKFAHKILLVDSSKSSLRHEIGHAYIAEKYPNIYRFFDMSTKPFNFITRKFGEIGDFISNILFSIAVGGPFLIAIIMMHNEGPIEFSLPLILVGIFFSLPMLDEILAIYFGEKFKPNR